LVKWISMPPTPTVLIPGGQEKNWIRDTNATGWARRKVSVFPFFVVANLSCEYQQDWGERQTYRTSNSDILTVKCLWFIIH
jgi:hypothetical protein